MKKYIVLFLSLIFILPMNGQGFLKKLGDQTVNKIQRKAENILLDELSEELANRAVRPLDTWMDSLFKESYERDTGKKYDPKDTVAFQKYMSTMFADVELPDMYKFDYSVEIEITDFDKKKSEKSYMYVNTTEDVVGFVQYNNGTKTLVVFDNVRGLMATYDYDKMEVIGFPINSAMMSSFSNTTVQNDLDDMDLKIRKLNKTKKVAGYQSEGYFATTTETETEAYFSDKVPFTWEETFGSLMKQFAVNFYKENDEIPMNGMLMLATSKRYSDSKKSKWEVKKIKQEEIYIKNKDFKQISFADQS